MFSKVGKATVRVLVEDHTIPWCRVTRIPPYNTADSDKGVPEALPAHAQMPQYQEISTCASDCPN